VLRFVIVSLLDKMTVPRLILKSRYATNATPHTHKHTYTHESTECPAPERFPGADVFSKRTFLRSGRLYRADADGNMLMATASARYLYFSPDSPVNQARNGHK